MSDEPAPGSRDVTVEEDPRVIAFRTRYKETEARLSRIFCADKFSGDGSTLDGMTIDAIPPAAEIAKPPELIKVVKAARNIDEDDYGDDEDGEDEQPDDQSPLLAKSAVAAFSQNRPSPSPINPPFPSKLPPLDLRVDPNSGDQANNVEDERKRLRLQEDKQAAEEAAKRNFNTLYYTLENDRIAMLEQQKLDELDRQVDAEFSGEQGSGSTGGPIAASQQGSLSTANLGASSLMLKHLLARVDAKRSLVKAQDSQLRRLISEVRKNRSKWASEDKIGQEELYEAAERVLQELKAMTEHSGPFLQKVNKREAPDYYTIIKHPMDIGTMQKKLKALQYKSKKEFVDDLHLIWNNCLKYNSDPNHPLRKKALIMQKHTDRLVVLIPDIVVRDRAEVEAEERRMQSLDADLDGLEDSDDEEPIMASRGRKAPGKKGKKGNATTRKAPPTINEDLSVSETKPALHSLVSSSNLRNNFLRADSDAPMENGFNTPPPGTLTPLGPNGIPHSGAPPSQADGSDADAGNSVNELNADTSEDVDVDDFEYQFWKHTTKKARAMVAAERHRLFRGDKINPEEHALLRSKAGMRRWTRLQKQLLPQEEHTFDQSIDETTKDGSKALQGETLAEGMEEEEDDFLPEYYDPVSAIPELEPRLKWEEDSDGNVINHMEECLRVVPKGFFTSPESNLTRKMDANMRQMQETRKVTAKIGIVKQMQIQTQVRRILSLTYLNRCANLYFRCIRTNSKSMTLSRWLTLTSKLWWFLMMVRSWYLGFVVLHYNVLLERFSIMLASKSFNLLPSTL
jgi:transcriptional activator SPT7